MFESLKKKLKSIFSFPKEEPAQEKPIGETQEIPEPAKAPEPAVEEKKEEIKESPRAPETGEILGNLRTALLESDVAYEAVEKICDEVKGATVGASVERGKTQETLKKALADSLKDIMACERPDVEKLIEAKQGVYLMLIFGTNGAGKTTTIAKLAHKFKKFRPVVAAGDTFRAASIEQLEEHSKKAGFDLVKHSYGADPAAVIFDARKHAEARKSKLIIGDTAGRSHSNANLMDELKKVARVNKPDMKVLVLDSLTGNDIYEQARIYDQAIEIG